MIVMGWRDEAHTIPAVAHDGDDVVVFDLEGVELYRVPGAVSENARQAALGPQPTALDRVAAVETKVADIDAVIVAVLT